MDKSFLLLFILDLFIFHLIFFFFCFYHNTQIIFTRTKLKPFNAINTG